MLERCRGGLAWYQDSKRAKLLRLKRASMRAERSKALAFYAPDFDLRDANPWYFGEPETSTVLVSPLPTLIERESPQPEAFFARHADILDRIRRGELQKVVPIVAEKLRFAEPLTAEMLHRPAKDGLYSYGLHFGDQGLSGLTPELLFEVEGDRLRTMALAGTAPVSQDGLLADPKERHEHSLVVEHLAAELKAYGRVETGAIEERRFGSLKHLLTPIEVRLQRPPEFEELVRLLHPTAALGGWPRERAREWLLADESSIWRRRFGAPFGFVEQETMVCVVAIRCVQWQGAQALVAAGCGVVEGSQAEKEWQELALKRAATLTNLGIL